MKRFLVMLLALAMVFSFAACGGTEPAPGGDDGDDAAGGYEIAMITDLGSIDDKSFNQGTWEGIVAYAGENGITHKYYKPTEQTTDAYLASIQLAVEGGAEVVVTPGFLFEAPIFIAQDLYEDVHFILIDGNPNDGDYSKPEGPTYRTNDNVVGIVYAEEQSGYLAGYAAVKDGYTKLGYMGGMAVPAVVRFGYGFAQGAEAAAAEMGIDSIDLKYHYTGNFDASPETQTLATSWYAEGIEVIFAAGGLVGNSVMSAAEAADAVVIGVDVDQSSESPTVITSAMKGLAASVQSALSAYYAGEFPGGQGLIYAADKDGVELPMATSKFKTFSQADYDKVFGELADGSIVLKKDTDAAGNELTLKDLGLSRVKAVLVE